MHRYIRFALSFTPAPDSDLAAMGKHWLGWDLDHGTEATFLKIDNLPHPPAKLAARVRRYGFQAQLIPPFRLARGHSPLDLHHTAQAVANHIAPIQMPGLRLAVRAEGLCLLPVSPPPELARFADIVRGVFESFRSPSQGAPQNIGLTKQQRAMLRMETPRSDNGFDLRFQISDALPDPELFSLIRVLRPILEPNLPRPFTVGALSLVGEDMQGSFRLIQRYPLTGQDAQSRQPVEREAENVRMPMHW